MRHLLNQVIEPSKLNSVILFMRKYFAVFTNEGQQEIEKSLSHTHALKVTGEKPRIVSGKLRRKKGATCSKFIYECDSKIGMAGVDRYV